MVERWVCKAPDSWELCVPSQATWPSPCGPVGLELRRVLQKLLRILMQEVYSGGEEYVFVTSLVTLIQVVHRWHLEKGHVCAIGNRRGLWNRPCGGQITLGSWILHYFEALALDQARGVNFNDIDYKQIYLVNSLLLFLHKTRLYLNDLQGKALKYLLFDSQHASIYHSSLVIQYAIPLKPHKNPTR